MRAVVIVLLFFAVMLAWRGGQRVQMFRQARTDASDARTKLRKARAARRSATGAAVAGWLMMAGALLLAGVLIGR